MRRPGARWDFAPIGRMRFIRILMGVVGLCLVIMTLEAPNLFRPKQLFNKHVPGSDHHLKSLIDSDSPFTRRNLVDETRATPETPDSSGSSSASTPTSNSIGNPEDQQDSIASNSSSSSALVHAADSARRAGAEMWSLIESSSLRRNSTSKFNSSSSPSLPKQQHSSSSQCPQVLMHSGDELRASNNVMLIPCGLASGSSITLAAKPLKAHRENTPRIRMLHDGESDVMVSQFMVELRGLKLVDGEDPPRILHVNPRLRGDWSSKPVVELNTCYRGQWGVAQRCEGWLSPEEDETVDGLPRCQHWLRDDEGTGSGGSNPEMGNKSWFNRWMVKSEKTGMDWLYPFTEERLFVMTIRAGWEGYHVSVDGRHIISFPYRTGFILEEATGFAIGGDLEVRSVVATSLPSSHTSLSSEQLLEESDKYKAPPLPKQTPVHLFIGILSASNHFAERMAVRKTWLQSKSVQDSLVVARFFVALHSDLEINLQVREEAAFFGDMVILPFIDHYDLVVLKTVAICEYAVRNISANHIMKTDDDTFVRVETISNQLRSTRKAPGLYMGNINQFHRPLREGKWAVTYEEWPEEEYPPYANGPGYIISADIAKFILDQQSNQTLRLFKMEDVSMGMWVVQFNKGQAVHYVHNLKFCQWGCIEEYYTAHYQSPRQMMCMWEKLQQGEALCCNMR